MGHDHHHGHSHGVSRESDRRWLTVALLVNVVFAVVEVVVGLIANSVALLSDAAHMVTDAGAIGLALFALWLAQRPARGAFTFGFRRAEILSAQLNAVALLVLAVLIGVEAVGRIVDPPEIDGGFVIAVGVIGAAVNGVAAWALSKANRESLNVEGAFLHNLMDLWSSVAAAVAGVLIVAAGWGAADGLAALTVCGLMLWTGGALLRDSGRVLLEAAPKGMDIPAIEAAIRAHDGVNGVDDLHVWEVTSGFPALSAHVLVDERADCHAARADVRAMLHDAFGIDHITLQVDHGDADARSGCQSAHSHA